MQPPFSYIVGTACAMQNLAPFVALLWIASALLGALVTSGFARGLLFVWIVIGAIVIFNYNTLLAALQIRLPPGVGPGCSAASIVPPSIRSAICDNYWAINRIAPVVLLVAAALILLHAVAVHRAGGNMVWDLVVDVVIVYAIINLPRITSALIGNSC